MTGGRAVILGPTGRNFAAGMSGGMAYVYDPNDQFLPRCNLGLVGLERVEKPKDVAELKGLIELHQRHTDSPVAAAILADWPNALTRFHLVMPTDYKKVIDEMEQEGEELEIAGEPGAVPHGS
jgi:glutamate synthase domain-containing protein 3